MTGALFSSDDLVNTENSSALFIGSQTIYYLRSLFVLDDQLNILNGSQTSPGAWVPPVCWGRDYDAINLPKAPSLTLPTILNK